MGNKEKIGSDRSPEDIRQEINEGVEDIARSKTEREDLERQLAERVYLVVSNSEQGSNGQKVIYAEYEPTEMDKRVEKLLMENLNSMRYNYPYITIMYEPLVYSIELAKKYGKLPKGKDLFTGYCPIYQLGVRLWVGYGYDDDYYGSEESEKEDFEEENKKMLILAEQIRALGVDCQIGQKSEDIIGGGPGRPRW